MTIKYFADIREVTGREEQRVGTPPTTLAALLAELCGQYGDAFARRVFDRGELHAMITILVNGRNVVHLAGLETPLKPDDVVAVFPMVAGG
jgi:molybdopterin synthase sulfur carrier subunit